MLASTTSVENSGLLAHIVPQFTKETGITVHVVAQGTGQALATAVHGDADLVLVHGSGSGGGIHGGRPRADSHRDRLE